MGGEHKGAFPLYLYRIGYIYCLGVDLHQGFIVQQDIHQWRMTQSRGSRERAIQTEASPCFHPLITLKTHFFLFSWEFGINVVVGSDNKIIIRLNDKSCHPYRMRILRTKRFSRCTRQTAPTTLASATTPPTRPTRRQTHQLPYSLSLPLVPLSVPPYRTATRTPHSRSRRRWQQCCWETSDLGAGVKEA